jgi:type I restriction enzyme, S subunit
VRLPKGWDVAEVGELGDVVTGSTPSTKQSTFYGGHIPFVRPQELLGSPIASTETTLTEEGAASGRVVPEGSVLVGCIGTLGKTGITTVSSAFNQQINAVVPGTACTSKWLLYGVQSPGFKRQMLDNSSATTVAIINKGRFSLLKLPIAPIEEQHRIVEAIESYLTRLDDAVASLKRVQRNLERYRASVLKAAVEGRLVPTEAELARQEGRTFEPASELLERILAERKARWIEDAAEKARAKAEAEARKAGKPWTPEDNAKALEKTRVTAEAKYKEPAPPDTSNLPALPEGWCWTTLDCICEVQGGLTKGKRRKTSDVLREVPYLRVANVQRGWLDLAEMKSIAATEEEIQNLILQHGDVLFNEGGDRDKLGRGWVWEGQISECIHQNHVFRARVVGEAILPKLLSWYGNSKGQEYFFGEGKQVVNLASLSQTRLKALPVPLPPQAEQVQIREEVERLISVSAGLENQVAISVKRGKRLRQSILKWAFEGKLVEQDPNDEPASVLLERIKMPRTIENGGRRAR